MFKQSVIVFVLTCSNLIITTRVFPSKGAIWPKPRFQKHSNEIVVVDEKHFRYQIVNQKCNLLKKVSERYLPPSKFLKYTNKLNANEDPSYLKMLNINLTTPCNDDEYPYFEMDESYHLEVSVNSTLESKSIWGIMRGLESFVQLVYIENKTMRMNKTKIEDKPLYPYRGLLIDTSRHFLNPSIIITLLDGMVMNKMNVLHWHMTDDESFPYQSKVFPLLSEKGAYYAFDDTSDRIVYTLEQIKYIVDYAKERGIRVIPEFDTPGHVVSWGASHPELIVSCDARNPLNPIRNTTYDFLQKLFAEVQKIFPDEYFHIGGDEVYKSCWSANQEIQDFVKKHNIRDLQAYFTDKLLSQCFKENTKFIAYEETYFSGATLPNDSIVDVWDTQNLMRQLPREKKYAIYSYAWYLDYKCPTFCGFYIEDPRRTFIEKKEDAKFIVGGQSCMWGEKADNTNIIAKVFPRTSAVAEVLWRGSDGSCEKNDDLKSRIEEHTCRMCSRHVMAEPPFGPGVCMYNIDPM